MPRNIRSEIFRKPFAGAVQLRVAVILAGNQQRGDFKANVRFVPEIFERVEYRPELGKTNPVIKRVSKRFKIDICRIHVPVKFRARVISDIAGRYRDRFDSVFAARLRHVDCVLGKNYRIIVSECDRPAPEPLRSERDLVRGRRVCELVPFARFGDVPVLAKPAA